MQTPGNSLRDHSWEWSYSTDEDDVVNDFYIPALKLADRYDRAVGFFSSAALALISPGLETFIKRGGKMRLIASPKNLSEEDLEAIVRGEKKKALSAALSDSLDDDLPPGALDRLSLMTWMVANGQLEFKVALRVKPDGRVELYHKKIGLFANVLHGEPLDYMTFMGSPNETAGGLVNNAEAFALHRSWITGFETLCANEKRYFDTAWNGQRPQIWTWQGTEWLNHALRQRFGSRSPDGAPIYVSVGDPQSRARARLARPALPDGFVLRGYQEEAVRDWFRNGARGTFAMATGTGKTETALACAVRLSNVALDGNRSLLIVVIVPSVDLVEQWRGRAARFGFRTHVWSGSAGRAAKSTARDAVRATGRGALTTRATMIIVTADSLPTFGEALLEYDGSLFVIGDEMHSLGTARRLASLPKKPTCTLGLSATPKRHRDDVGTDKLLEYFGEPILSISIRQAIEELDALCRYFYHMSFVSLTSDESDEFRRLSRMIAAALGAGNDADRLIQKRTNLLSHASAKFEYLRALALEGENPLCEQKAVLVYVGEGTGWSSTVSSVDRVTEMLGNEAGMRVASYTNDTKPDERHDLQEMLAAGDIDALVAMRCLDEGIDIPEAQIGVVLASTQNPRQFVQRRGRILRKHLGKVRAHLYDVLVVPQVDSEMSASDETALAAELSRAFELADAAENRSEVVYAITTAAIEAGLTDDSYPWMQGSESDMPEWSA